MSDTSLIIGHEYDDKLIKALLEVLTSLGAIRISEHSSLAGSQDLQLIVFDIEGSLLTVENETYIGLRLYGPSKLIELIKNRINEIRNPLDKEKSY